ncbi:MAG: serine hydrolase [Chitinophagaceae bacterium]
MLGILLFTILVISIYVAWGAFPGISGYGAKNLCSCLFVGDRDEQTVRKEELSDGFIRFGTFTVNREDSSVTGTVLGLAKRKAIYRPGAGCTLINDITEKELRNQNLAIPATRSTDSASLPWLVHAFADTNNQRIDIDKINLVVKNIFQDTGANKKIKTRAVIIIHDGKMLIEKYATGFNENNRLIGWSIAKSITSAMIGILVNEGKLNVNDLAPVPAWKDEKDKRHYIKIEHLLQQTSGLDFVEKYGRPSEVITMLFSKGDMAKFAASRPLKSAPGMRFNYTSGNTNILQGIIRQTVGEGSYHSFPYTALFQKIGMSSAILETDAAGNFVGSSYLYATPRDFARFGLLYLNDGVWNGERILPEGWVKQSCIPAEAEPQKQYGYQFWLNGFDVKNPSKRIFSGVPDDMFYADGYGGQRIFIIPSKKLVVVRMGLHVFDEKTFLREIVEAID